jgi:Cdc6-like AAA superfamily ATPase
MLELHNKFYTITRSVSASFTGRDEVCDQLQKACLPSHKPTRQLRFVLYGLGGSGKTQIALKFAQDFRER